MALTEKTAGQLAALLPEGLSCDDSRARLLCLVNVMHALTDSEHRLTNSDIRLILNAYTNGSCDPAENTINADLRALRDQGVLGMRVHTSPAGSWCESDELPPSQVRLLLNAVQASRFLTTEQSFALQEDLMNLVSRHQEESLVGEVFVDQRTRSGYQQVFETNDLIAQAIRKKQKIEFEYTYTGFDGCPHVLEGDDGSTLRVETPIGLVFSDNNYYLESYSEIPWRHGAQVMRSRVDRMYNVRVSNEPADRNAQVVAAKRSLKKRVATSTEMVGGPLRTIFLRVRADYTNIMFDQFGFKLKFGQFSGPAGDANTTAVTCVRVAESFTFFRWLSSAGGGIVLVRPESEIWLQTGPWPKRAKQTPLETLQADYESMRAEYLAYLDRARLACE